MKTNRFMIADLRISKSKNIPQKWMLIYNALMLTENVDLFKLFSRNEQNKIKTYIHHSNSKSLTEYHENDSKYCLAFCRRNFVFLLRAML